MDIRKFSVEQTGRLQLLDAKNRPMLTEDGKPCVVVVYSPASKQFAAAQAAQRNRLLDKLREKEKSDTTAEQNEKEKAEFLCDCTAAFENIDYDKLTGRDLFYAVYSDSSIGFIADQVHKFAGEWGNFTKG